MKKLSKRQSNYRARRRLMQELRIAFELQRTLPEDALAKLYKKLIGELLALDSNKGEK